MLFRSGRLEIKSMGHYTEVDLISKLKPQEVSPMQVHIELHLEANIPKDRANANEIFLEVTRVSKEAKEKIALAVIEAYEENIIEVLCDSNVPESKEGLGRHTRKGESKEWCQCRTFERAGYRSDKRRLRGNGFRIKFKPEIGRASCRERV